MNYRYMIPFITKYGRSTLFARVVHKNRFIWLAIYEGTLDECKAMRRELEK